MNAGWICRIAVFLGVLTVCAVYLGGYMARVFSGEKTLLSGLLSLMITIRPVTETMKR